MNKHLAHRTYMSLYKHDITNSNKFTHCYFYIRLIKAEYTNFAVE